MPGLSDTRWEPPLRRTHPITARAAIAAVAAAAGVLGAVVAPASATTFRGAIKDPVERPSDPSRDITRIASSFDTALGQLDDGVTFAAAPTEATSARLRVSLGRPGAYCSTLQYNALGFGFGVYSATGAVAYANGCSTSLRPDGTSPASTTVRRSADGHVLRVRVVDPTTIGMRPTVMNQTRFSLHTIYDMVPATRLFTPGAPATIGIGPSTRFVVTSQKRTLAMPLSGVSRTSRASVRIVVGHHTIARRTLTIHRGDAKLRMTLSKGAYRRVSRHGTKATLEAELASGNTTRTLTRRITLVRFH
jgi:hypothetical protein